MIRNLTSSECVVVLLTSFALVAPVVLSTAMPTIAGDHSKHAAADAVPGVIISKPLPDIPGE